MVDKRIGCELTSGLVDMKHRSNITGSNSTLYPYYWRISEEGEAGKAVPLDDLK